MGEAAEWEIYRLHGIDTSDDGWITKTREGTRPRTSPGRNLHAGEGNYEARKYKVNLQERPRGFSVVYIENNTSRAGAFTVDREGSYTWLPEREQRLRVDLLRTNSLTEARAGSQYSMARGMIDNAKSWGPAKGIHMWGEAPPHNPGPPTPPAPRYEDEIETYADETEVRERELEGTTNMSNSREAIALMQLHNGARLYGVKFMAEGFVKPEQKTYTYKDTSGLDLAVMDLVVVEARDSVAIAQIVQLNVSPSASTMELGKVRHIVSKIDQVSHGAKLAKENEAVERLAMAEVGERLEKFRQQLGTTNFESVRMMLGGPVVDKPHAPTIDQGTRNVRLDERGHMIDVDTGEDYGRFNFG